jgi:orotate phosphoribosyltransferase-like protein
MSAMKRLIEDVLEMYENGLSVMEIAESMGVEMEVVESLVNEYSDW